jgi:hypothetical protein
MARFRIKQRPSYCTSGRAIFLIEERWFFWWKERGLVLSLQEAEQRVKELQDTKPVETKVIKEYD